MPIYSSILGLETEVRFDERNGLKRPSAARCDEVTSMAREVLTDFIGNATARQLGELSRALAVALAIRAEELSEL